MIAGRRQVYIACSSIAVLQGAVKLATEQKLRDRTPALAVEVLSAETGFRGAGPGEFRDIIQAAEIVAYEADQFLQRWALAVRREGMSWTDVGDALGISKQGRSRGSARPSQNRSWLRRTRSRSASARRLSMMSGSWTWRGGRATSWSESACCP